MSLTWHRGPPRILTTCCHAPPTIRRDGVLVFASDAMNRSTTTRGATKSASAADIVIQIVSLIDSDATTFRVIDTADDRVLFNEHHDFNTARSYAVDLAEGRHCCIWQEYCDKRGRAIGQRVLLLDRRHV